MFLCAEKGIEVNPGALKSVEIRPLREKKKFQLRDLLRRSTGILGPRDLSH
jgi:hypothetical protein